MLRTLTTVTLAAAALALTVALPARAQFELKGGFSYSDVTNSGALPGSPKQRSGFAAGIGIEPASVLGIGFEGLYAQRGVSSSTAGTSWNIDYIDVPVYLRFRLPIPGLAPFAYAGPQGSYELQCSTGSGSCPATNRPKWTYAGVIGAGLQLVGRLSLEGRYIYGLTNLNLSTVTTSSSYQTRSFLVLAGLRL